MTTPTDPIIKQILINAPPERVFDFIIDPSKMTRWIGVGVQFDPTPGGRVQIDPNGHPNGRDVIHGTVIHVVRPTKVAFTWGWEGAGYRVQAGATVVEISLEPENGGTRLTLTHRELPADAREKHDFGWTHYLGRLQIAAEGGDPGSDPFADPNVRHAM
jgi:uncharacterized protein YndB with AHSA1/START domain